VVYESGRAETFGAAFSRRRNLAWNENCQQNNVHTPSVKSDRKHPSAAFWATVVLVAALVGYPLSFGPACWLADYSGMGKEIIPMIFTPAIWCSANGAAPVSAGINWWAHLCCKNEWGWAFDTDGKYHWVHLLEIVDDPSGSM
jgi:hypothetical protein